MRYIFAALAAAILIAPPTLPAQNTPPSPAATQPALDPANPKTFIAPDATAPLANKKIRLSDFHKNGAAAGIQLGDDINKVVSLWGIPSDIVGDSKTGFWTFTYRNASVRFLFGKLQEVTLITAASDFVLDNNISGKSFRHEIIRILGKPNSVSPGVLKYNRTTGGPLEFRFKLNEHLPKDEAQWQKATLAEISVNAPIFRTPKEPLPRPTGYHAAINSLLGSPDSLAPLHKNILDFAAFSEKGALAGLASGDPFPNCLTVWGPGSYVSSSGNGQIWHFGYANATLRYMDGKLNLITIQSAGKHSFAFSNGLSNKSTVEQATAILGPLKQLSPNSGTFKQGLILFNFYNQMVIANTPELLKTATLDKLTRNSTQ